MLPECQMRVYIIYFGENVAVVFSRKSKACRDGYIYYTLPFLGPRLEVLKTYTVRYIARYTYTRRKVATKSRMGVFDGLKIGVVRVRLFFCRVFDLFARSTYTMGLGA